MPPSRQAGTCKYQRREDSGSNHQPWTGSDDIGTPNVQSSGLVAMNRRKIGGWHQ